MTLSEPLARTRDRLTEMATELRHGKPGNYTLAVAGRVPQLLDHIEGLTAELALIARQRQTVLDACTWEDGEDRESVPVEEIYQAFITDPADIETAS